jgi:hypothetical protein
METFMIISVGLAMFYFGYLRGYDAGKSEKK